MRSGELSSKGVGERSGTGAVKCGGGCVGAGESMRTWAGAEGGVGGGRGLAYTSGSQ